MIFFFIHITRLKCWIGPLPIVYQLVVFSRILICRLINYQHLVGKAILSDCWFGFCILLHGELSSFCENTFDRYRFGVIGELPITSVIGNPIIIVCEESQVPLRM